MCVSCKCGRFCACAPHLLACPPYQIYCDTNKRCCVCTYCLYVTFLLVSRGVTFLVFAFLFVGFAIKLRCNTLFVSTARLTRAVRCSLSEFSVLVTGFTCFFIFPFLFAFVVPLFLRLHLDLGCYVPFGFERSHVSGFCLPFCRFCHHASS